MYANIVSIVQLDPNCSPKYLPGVKMQNMNLIIYSSLPVLIMLSDACIGEGCVSWASVALYIHMGVS